MLYVFLVMFIIALIIAGLFLKGVSLLWIVETLPIYMTDMILPNIWYILIACAILIAACIVLAKIPFNLINSSIAGAFIGGGGTAILMLLVIIEKLFVGSNQSWVEVIFTTILGTLMFTACGAIVFPPVVDLCGFVGNLPALIFKKKKDCLGYLATMIGHIGLSMLVLTVYLAMFGDSFGHTIMNLKHDFIRFGASYSIAHAMTNINIWWMAAVSLVLAFGGLVPAEILSMKNGEPGLLIFGIGKIIEMLPVNGSSTQTIKEPAHHEEHVQAEEPVAQKDVRHVYVKGIEVYEIDGNEIRKPSGALLKGELVYEIDGNEIRKPSGALLKGELVYEIDGNTIRKPSGALMKGDAVYEICGDTICRPSGAVFRGEEVATIR